MYSRVFDFILYTLSECMYMQIIYIHVPACMCVCTHSGCMQSRSILYVHVYVHMHVCMCTYSDVSRASRLCKSICIVAHYVATYLYL